MENNQICKSCGMPITKPEYFGTEANGNENSNYCRHCYENGIQLKGVTMDNLIDGVQKLYDIENEHPGLLSRSLLSYIKDWLPIEDKTAKTTTLPILLAKLVNGQDCDFTGTQWEKEWLADGKVCYCIACNAARKCIAQIKQMLREQ